MFDVKLNSGAREFLDSVQQTGITQSLLSAAKVQMLETLIEYHKLQDYFIRIVGLDNHYAHSKLSAGEAWMAELPFQPSEVLYIGDTIHDVDVARELGVDIALLAMGHTDTARLNKTGKLVLNNFAELEDWFMNQNIV